MSFASEVHAQILKHLPAPSPVIGTVVVANGTQVLVSGIDGAQPIPCDWSPSFADEMADTPDVVGRKVLVHMVNGQPIVAHTIIIGEKG